MSFKLKKCTALFLAVVMSIFSAQVNAFAMIAPRVAVAVQISMSTDADQSNEVRPNDEITATVTWKSVLAPTGEPITIRVTNGAEILIYNQADVVFRANGVPASIQPVTRSTSGDVVTFISGTPATSPLENKITFQIKSPSSAGDFKLSVKIGSDSTAANPLTNFVEREFTILPLTVNTSLDIVDGAEPFEVFGEVAVDDAFIIAMEIHNKETGDIAFGSTTMDISSNGRYTLGLFSFNESHAAGVYIVEVVLLDSGFNPVGTVKKEIQHVTEQIVSVKFMNVDTGEIFLSYSKKYNYGATISPEVIYSNYSLVGALVNGQPVEGGKVKLTTNGPTEVVFQFEILYGIRITSINLARPGLPMQVQISTGGHPNGAVVDVTAPEFDNYEVVGVLVNGQRATLINGNQVQVTINGSMEVTFEYRSL